MTNNISVAIIKKTEDGVDKYLLGCSILDYGKCQACYYPPGGHGLKNETEEQTLIRKLKQEVNLDIRPVKKIVVTKGDVEGIMINWWECAVIGGDFKINTGCLSRAGYYDLLEIKNLKLWPATRKFFEEYVF